MEDEHRTAAAKARLKRQVAQELDLDDDIRDRGFANMTTREVGLIGGHMVRRLVQEGEERLAEEVGAEPPADSGPKSAE